MKRNIHKSQINKPDYIANIFQGGTYGDEPEEARDNLDIVGLSEIDRNQGVAGLDSNGKISLNVIPTSLKGTTDDFDSIIGETVSGEVRSNLIFTISNFDSFKTYIVSVSSGTVNRVDDVITVTLPTAAGVVFLNINSRVINLTCVDTSYILKPSFDYINNPFDQRTDVSVIALNMRVIGVGATDTHVSSDWELSKFSDFSIKVETSYNDVSNKTIWPLIGLEFGTRYYVRVRYKADIRGYSEWSDAQYFDTEVQIVINKPTITSLVDGAIDVDNSDVVFNSSMISFSSGTDAHISTDWQISELSYFPTIVTELLNSQSSLRAWSVSSLPYSTKLYIRVRYKTANGIVGPWSDPISFTTRILPGIKEPFITYPSFNSSVTNTSITVISDDFTVYQGYDTHYATDWIITTDPSGLDGSKIVKQSFLDQVNKTSFDVTGLEYNKIYYVSTRYHGFSGVNSSWGSSHFTVNQPIVLTTPIITTPVSGATNQDTDIYPYITNFGTLTGIDSIHSSEWQLSTSPVFSSYIEKIVTGGYYITTGFTGLSNNTVYYLRARYKGISGVYSNWSSTITLTTKAAELVLNITANTVDYVLNTSKIAGYIPGVTNRVTVNVNSGVVMSASSSGTYSLTFDSSWNSLDLVTLVNNGYIVGAGGYGGAGGTSAAGNATDGGYGGGGGAAMNIQKSGILMIDNLNGTIAGGGGGGGGGGGASQGGSIPPNGGAGGSGAGAGGNLNPTGGGSGGSLSNSTSGSGGAGGTFGNYGSPGTNGTGSANYQGKGGGGGSPGPYMLGYSKVLSWINNGTRIGSAVN